MRCECPVFTKHFMHDVTMAYDETSLLMESDSTAHYIVFNGGPVEEVLE